MRLADHMMAILDATVAHLVAVRNPSTVLLYKMIALRWYDQEGVSSAAGLSWYPLPDGRRHCVLVGVPLYAHDDGSPLTLEELGV